MVFIDVQRFFAYSRFEWNFEGFECIFKALFKYCYFQKYKMQGRICDQVKSVYRLSHVKFHDCIGISSAQTTTQPANKQQQQQEK